MSDDVDDGDGDSALCIHLGIINIHKIIIRVQIRAIRVMLMNDPNYNNARRRDTVSVSMDNHNGTTTEKTKKYEIMQLITRMYFDLLLDCFTAYAPNSAKHPKPITCRDRRLLFLSAPAVSFIHDSTFMPVYVPASCGAFVPAMMLWLRCVGLTFKRLLFLHGTHTHARSGNIEHLF